MSTIFYGLAVSFLLLALVALVVAIVSPFTNPETLLNQLDGTAITSKERVRLVRGALKFAVVAAFFYLAGRGA